MSQKKGIDQTVLIIAVIGSLILINVIGLAAFWRADMTRNKEFTLNRASVDLVKNLKDPVTVRAYFSADLPGPLATTARYVKDLLEEYYAVGGANIRYQFIDPTSTETEEDKQKKKDLKRDLFGQLVREKTSVEQELESLGIRPVPIQVNEADKVEQKLVYLGIAVTFGNKKEVIPVVQKTEELEYELTTMIRKVSQVSMPKVALITGHNNPETTNNQMDMSNEYKESMSAFYTTLQQLYSVSSVDLSKNEKIGDDVNAILVIGPKTAFSDAELRAIDAFIMTGRSAAFLLGPTSVDLRSLQDSANEHGLAGLLASYGVNLDPGLALDVQSGSMPVQQKMGQMMMRQDVRYPFFAMPKPASAEHPLTRGIGAATFPWIGPLSVKKDLPAELKATVLMKSSPNSWVQQPPYNLDPFHQWTREEAGDMTSHDLLVSLEGAIPSHFSAPGAGEPQKSKNARVLVAANHGFVMDPFFSWFKGNQALVLNMMDWLVMDEALLAIRSRGLDASPLEEISDGARNTVKYANIVGLPLIFLAFGLLRWRLRESRRKNITL